MVVAIGINDTLQPGAVYTLSFDAGAIHASFEEIDAALQYLSVFSGVTATFDHGIINDRLDVTGTYVGDGSYDLSGLVQLILNSLPSGLLSGSFNYVGTRMGSTGAGEGNVTFPKLPTLPDVSNLFKAGSSLLWPVLLLVGLGVFLFYGGGNVLKPLLKRASG